MNRDQIGRWQPRAAVGIAANIVLFALYQYYRISVEYFPALVIALLMTTMIFAFVIGCAAWASVFLTIARQKGQPEQLAYMAPLGLVGLGVMHYLKDHHAKTKVFAQFRQRNMQRNLAKGRAR